jgi:hypothetical protein
MNEQSLAAANDFLRVASATIQPGDFLDRAPTDIGKDAGLPNPLAVARAVRALAARRRLEAVEGKYRLLDGKPLEPGEPESVPRTPRRRKGRKRAGRAETPQTGDRRPTYADLGRALVDRMVELSREAGDAVASSETLRHDAKENRAARIEEEQRARRLFERVKELEHKLEMAEANLRTVLAAARGRGATAAPSDTEMDALLKILKTPGGDGHDDEAALAVEAQSADGPGIDLSGEPEAVEAEAVEEAPAEPVAETAATGLDAEAAASNAE